MAKQYRNIIRPGVRSSTSIDPRSVMEDIDEKLRKLSPEATPILTLGSYMGRGAKPKGHKISVRQYDVFDEYDFVNRVVLGTTVNPDYGRLAKIFLTQPSRPDVQDTMPYQPQDKFFIEATGQTVEVVMNPSGSMTRSENNQLRYTFPIAFTGNTESTTEPGSIIVRVIEPIAFSNFATSDVVYMGRTIYESQRIEAVSNQRDYYYDCNFVEHKEKVLHMTEDQRYLVQTLGKVPDWNFQQLEMMNEFKREIEQTLMWGERSFDGTVAGLPKRHMRGLFNSIQTNVAYYNPDAIDNFETLMENFGFDMAFRYNPNGKKKVALVGGRFLMRFNNAFKDFRQTQGTNPKDKVAGLDMDTFILPGGFELKLMRSEILRQNTRFENWCFVLDPAEMEQRIVKDFNTRMYQGTDERINKLMVEWQGTVAWHVEQSNALLRTI